jgi:hypothetical protein
LNLRLFDFVIIKILIQFIFITIVYL